MIDQPYSSILPVAEHIAVYLFKEVFAEPVNEVLKSPGVDMTASGLDEVSRYPEMVVLAVRARQAGTLTRTVLRKILTVIHKIAS